jgi:hypothetical protein
MGYPKAPVKENSPGTMKFREGASMRNRARFGVAADGMEGKILWEEQHG